MSSAARSARALTLSVLLCLSVVSAPARGAGVQVAPYEPLNELFHAYGDAGATWQRGQARTWTGGDSTFSVELPDGRVVWIFSDSFLSPIDGCGVAERQTCHRRRPFQGFVNNSMVIERDGVLTETLHGGTPDAPQALVVPPSPNDLTSFYWMGDATVEGDALRVFVHRYPKSPGIIPPQIANDIATFSLPDMTLRSIEEGVGAGGVRPWAFVPGGDSPVPVIWGAAVLEQGDYTYVYGTEEYPLFKHLHVARAPRGRLTTAPWEYFDGAGWSTSPASSVRIAHDVAGELSIVATGSGFRMITSRLGIGEIRMSTALRPEGPWGASVHVYSPPEAARGAWTYNAHEHPHLSNDERIVVSYNVNGSVDGNDIYDDVHVYRARFIEVTL